MNLIVNGDRHQHTGDGSVLSLLNELGANPEHSALTVNGQVVVSKEWETFRLSENDTVEVLTFVGGG